MDMLTWILVAAGVGVCLFGHWIADNKLLKQEVGDQRQIAARSKSQKFTESGQTHKDYELKRRQANR